jgi:hypothetical protein
MSKADVNQPRAKVKWSGCDSDTLVQRSVSILSALITCPNVLCRVNALNVADGSEIDWNRLQDSEWDSWNPHILRRRWGNLKSTIVGHEEKSHEGLFVSLYS